MSHTDCVFCRSVVNDVEDRRESGQVVHPAEMTTHSIKSTLIQPLAYSVEIDLSTGPDEVWGANGAIVSPGKAERGLMTAVLVFQAQHWLVREVDLQLSS